MELDPEGVAAAFGLGRPLGRWRALDNGDRPSDSRRLTTTGGRWVVRTDRLLGEWHRAQAHRVHTLEGAAWSAGIPMPRPVDPPSPAVGFWHQPAGDTLVRVTAWLDGHDLRHADAAGPDVPRAAAWAGTTLARVARLGTGAGSGAGNATGNGAGSGDGDGDGDGGSDSGSGGAVLHPLADWRAWVAEAEAGRHPVAAPARALLPAVEDATALVEDALRDRPATVLVHGDTSRANVLRTPDGYALIDWEGVRADVPWWEAVNVAFRFATPFNGPTADGDPRVVRPLLTAYREAGGPDGPADVSAFAGLLRSQLASVAWCLWLALGHRGAGAAQRAFGLGIVTSAAEAMPHVMRSLPRWTPLLR
jgi:hypothetical protein